MAKAHIQTVGRRKRAVARVIIKPGKGEWWVNSRSLEDYFPRPTHQQRIGEPLKAAEMDSVSQALPRESPSVFFWSRLETAGQLS